MNRESVGAGGGGMAAGGNRNGNQNSTTSSLLSMEDEAGAMGAAEVRVVADEENNSLMIYSTGLQYKLIRAALEKLDTPPTQVMIEASIIEVTLTDELSYGLEWTFNGQLGGSEYNGVGTLSDGNFNLGSPDSPLGQLARGFSYSVTGGSGDIVAVLQALSTQSLINVISSPSVMVLDNNTAYIHVGDQVPIRSGSTVSNGGNVTENITYRDTGVKLSVRPSVNAGGLVTLDVEQSVTDVGPIDVTGNRRFLEREIMSRVAVRSGESVVLGGLIRENATNSEEGVPWLHKVPLIGALFGTTDKSDTRTELVVMITPRALYNDAQLREVSESMKAQVRNFDLFDIEVK
ncbi:general (Type II) secretion pathway (GSP) D protein [Luminiphilus syltensis NOR5-1B]|uniref:General (Type II) secretion pathway (GSP) D protein n=2 Tax=Luminiphilus TaxID=1341118 RepID=B8KWZ1_9GAMM|nr:general (Type II) secretion pathway (GSP) D protein [Luminiphilus syltensis NOR5-1B]